MQESQTVVNGKAWNTKAYQAWLNYFGAPSEQALKIIENPEYPLRRWLKYMGDPSGKRIINLLGSTGRKAIALASLGADVTIVDISSENQQYALEVAEYANVPIQYILSDVLNIPKDQKLQEFDIVLMEFGVLHYFASLDSIFNVVQNLLKDNGRFILTDFHPFSSKLLASTDNSIKDGANYFDTNLVEENIAYMELLPEEERASLPKVLLRKWTMGEILSALADNSFILRKLEEEPHVENSNFPAYYTIVADKLNVDLTPLTP